MMKIPTSYYVEKDLKLGDKAVKDVIFTPTIRKQICHIL